MDEPCGFVKLDHKGLVSIFVYFIIPAVEKYTNIATLAPRFRGGKSALNGRVEN